MKRSYLAVCIALIAFALTTANVAHANPVFTYDINLPGIGSQIPVESFSIGIGSGGTLGFTTMFDAYTPAMAQALSLGTIFPTSIFTGFSNSGQTPVPIFAFEITNLRLNSVTANGDFLNWSGTYDSVTKIDTSVPEPSSLLLLGTGLAVFTSQMRRRLLRQ